MLVNCLRSRKQKRIFFGLLLLTVTSLVLYKMNEHVEEANKTEINNHEAQKDLVPKFLPTLKSEALISKEQQLAKDSNVKPKRVNQAPAPKQEVKIDHIVAKNLSAVLHPQYNMLIREYPFQPVRNQRNELVNVILVRSMMSPHHFALYDKYKNDILFMGISSMEDYPLRSPNPYSQNFPNDRYVGLFPGWLNMFRDTSVYPSHVKVILLSQSDFSLPPPVTVALPKKYDFTFSGSDQDVHNGCVGWSSFAKNLSFFHDAIALMCADGMTGVYVASKKNDKKCPIPPACEGKITQTFFLPQNEFLNYVQQSHFLFLPQVHDASPRVITQALSVNVPVLMNYHIMGGWKYVTERTGEYFHDLTDIRAAIQRLKDNRDKYEPRKYIDETTGDNISGPRLYKFVVENFSDRVKLPEGTTRLFPSGA